ncbi:RNA 2',3'-cyclic phosphodiesterase [Rossellomorea vietnamensis]|uniref:RNA 2',3'-cyclic phosphodiesterase n=1 Tax=Rossellomorea vietnamensis TaxID=218284 RepID=A0A5D4P1D1_9BACI|nr:RNA 2',3'-cyclic phosphodiesterase [Rossellomorea vietnamensis]TYS19811.1 RNA 2',3'-cyclic phosphodiesterase [Rossellomorea vietnamensis]
MKQHHYFYAVPLPQDTKKSMDDWSSRVKAALRFQRWVHPEDYHITLAFLGSTEEERLRKSIDRIHEVKKELSSFSLTVQNLGTFGNPSSPRILWSDVSPSSSLSTLRDAVYSECLQEGYELDKRPFNPHITIARKWGGDERFAGSLLTPFSLKEPLGFRIEEFVLYRTHLDRTPKYEEVEKFTLIL